MRLVLKAALIAFFAAVLVLPAAGPAEAVQLEWHPYLEGLKFGQEQQKKIFIFFYANWCGYCRKMEKETFTDPAAAAYLRKHFVLVRVNTDKAKALAREYAARAVPQSWFLSPSGEKITRLPGFVPPKFLLAALKYIQTESYKKMDFKEFTQKKLHEK